MLVVLGVVVLCALLIAAFLLGCYAMTTTAWQFERERDEARSDLRLATQEIRHLEADAERRNVEDQLMAAAR